MTDTPPHTPFAVEAKREGVVAIVAVTGEFDIATSPEFKTVLARLEPGYEKLVVDLSGCSFFASSGISMLLEENHRADTEGFEFVIIKAPPKVQRMFDLVGLQDTITFQAQE